MQKYLSRKFLLAVAGTILIVLLKPESAKQAAEIIGLPSLFIIIEGIKDIIKKD